MLSRRHVIHGLGALAASSGFAPRLSFAGPGSGPEAPRLIVVILRGALDGLAAVPAYGDPSYRQARGTMALPPPGAEGGGFVLDDTFALHPRLRTLHALYQGGDLAICHAVATPYRDRSHFDGQNVLESGALHPFETADGWLNRALAALPGDQKTGKPRGLAMGSTVPLILRGSEAVTSWSPSVLPALDEDTLHRLRALYRDDELLRTALTASLETDAMMADVPGMAAPLRPPRRPRRDIEPIINAVGKLLSAPEGPRVAVLSLSGWDTHANQGRETGSLATRLGQLDAGLGQLKTALGPTWDKTAVLIVSEFGRTVAGNGTGGTDHGTGGVAFLAGGAISGGRVIADWPGLAKKDLFEGRDLRPTLDLRALLKGVLGDHMGIARGALDRQVFPASDDLPPLPDLITRA